MTPIVKYVIILTLLTKIVRLNCFYQNSYKILGKLLKFQGKSFIISKVIKKNVTGGAESAPPPRSR